MEGDRGVSVLAHPDQWARCRHEGTALLPDGGVQLDWEEPPAPTPPAPCASAGLAFDRWCRAYRGAGGVPGIAETGAAHAWPTSCLTARPRSPCATGRRTERRPSSGSSRFGAGCTVGRMQEGCPR